MTGRSPSCFGELYRDILRYSQQKLDENNVQEYNIQYTILCSLNKNTHSMYGGDCDAAIAKAAAAVTHVQSQKSQEVGSGDGRAGLVVF